MNQARLLSLYPLLTGRLSCFDEVDSTLDVTRELLSQGADRPVVLADRQTAGRGRKGRSFVSPAGEGLYLSMALPLPEGALPPTLRAACGVCRGLEGLIGRRVEVKWVNDLLLDRYKVVGILAEGSGGWVVLGIGINVNSPEGLFGSELPHVSSLRARCGRSFPLEEAAAAVISAVETAWVEPPEVLFTYYKERLVTLGQSVRVIDGPLERRGEAVGLADDGGLLVRFEGGEQVEAVVCGDVSVRGLWGYV